VHLIPTRLLQFWSGTGEWLRILGLSMGFVQKQGNLVNVMNSLAVPFFNGIIKLKQNETECKLCLMIVEQDIFLACFLVSFLLLILSLNSDIWMFFFFMAVNKETKITLRTMMP